MIRSALLILEDGTQFYGRAIGVEGEAVGEVIFNTAITGYQEILTDPSYFHQIIAFTYPHIGNVGTNKSDNESSRIQAQAIVVRDLSLITSNFRNKFSLSDYLKQQNIVGITDIDTRKLTRVLRKKGTQTGCIINSKYPNINLALQKARKFSTINGIDLINKVSTKKKYIWTEGSFNLEKNEFKSQKKNLFYNVVVYDYGIKRNIMRILVDYGCKLTVIPAKTPAKTVIDLNPDGIFLSNGPGDPSTCNYAIYTIKKILTTNIPLFGICLGHQLLALASGAKTIKMKFGHHGSNHPVKDLETNRIMITTQNHCFTVDKNTLPPTLKITHISLFDGTLQGFHHVEKPAFGFQGHPEASPGPHDALKIFYHFINLMNAYRL